MAITDIGFAIINPEQPNSSVSQPTQFFAPYATLSDVEKPIAGVAIFDGEQFDIENHVVSLKGSQTFDALTVDTLTVNTITSNGNEVSFDKNIDANGHTLVVSTITSSDSEVSFDKNINASGHIITASTFNGGTLYINTIRSAGGGSAITIAKNIDLGENTITATIGYIPYLITGTIGTQEDYITFDNDIHVPNGQVVADSFTGNVTGNLTGDASGTNLQYTNGSITNLSVQHLELQSGTEIEFESALSENAIIVTNSNGATLAVGANSGLVIITGAGVNDAYPAEAAPLYDSSEEALVLGQGTYYGINYSVESKRNTFEFGVNQKQLLATRSSNIANGNLLKWDNEHHTIVDAGVAITAADKTAWNAKQDTLTFDNTPTQDSANPVKSGGVYTALQTTKNYVDSNLPVIKDWTV